MTKVCSVCGQEKNISKFNKAQKGKYGVRGDCSKCYKVKQAGYRKKLSVKKKNEYRCRGSLKSKKKRQANPKYRKALSQQSYSITRATNEWTRAKAHNHYQKWTEREIRYLRENSHRPYKELAIELNRTLCSIYSRYQILGLKKKSNQKYLAYMPFAQMYQL